MMRVDGVRERQARAWWWGHGTVILLAALVGIILLPGCFSGEEPTPTVNPFLIPGTSELEYRDDELGFSFRYQDDWTVTQGSETEGIVASLVSPDQTVTFEIERDLPPPQIDFMSYGAARMRFFQQVQPSLTIVDETETTLSDGTPAYHADWRSRNEEAETTGETLVIFRGEGDDREAFMIVSSGPTPLYNAWTGPILFFYESLKIEQQ